MTSPNRQPQQNPVDLPPGAILRKTYRIERKVGGGAMAVVYRVVDIGTGTVWAVKEMRPQPGSMTNLDEARKQFEQEAKLLFWSGSSQSTEGGGGFPGGWPLPTW